MHHHGKKTEFPDNLFCFILAVLFFRIRRNHVRSSKELLRNRAEEGFSHKTEVGKQARFSFAWLALQYLIFILEKKAKFQVTLNLSSLQVVRQWNLLSKSQAPLSPLVFLPHDVFIYDVFLEESTHSCIEIFSYLHISFLWRRLRNDVSSVFLGSNTYSQATMAIAWLLQFSRGLADAATDGCRAHTFHVSLKKLTPNSWLTSSSPENIHNLYCVVSLLFYSDRNTIS